MSTSLLYHAFGIQGYRYVRTAYVQGQTIFTLSQKPNTCRCSACGFADVVSRGHVERRFRCLPIGSRPTVLVFAIPRVECRACGVVRQVDITFADPRRSYTKRFERYVLELSRRMTIRDVAPTWALAGTWSRMSRSVTCRGAMPSPSSSTCGGSPSTRSPSPAGIAI